MTTPISVDDLLRRIKVLEQALGVVPAKPPLSPVFPPSVPLTTSRCGKCGLELYGVMGYVCPHSDCPTFVNPRY